MDGTFVETLASAISRIRHCTSLCFVDQISNKSYPPPYIREHIAVATSLEGLSRLMVAPFHWNTIEKLEGGAEVLPAKIPSELLIAIHKAGTTMPLIETQLNSHGKQLFHDQPQSPGL